MRRALIATVAGAGLTLTACGGGATTATPSPGSPITIGVSVSLSGDFSSDGPALERGYDLWAEDVNKKGGLNGHHVTMKYVDDASSTQLVVSNYQKLISSDKVDLVFGPYSSLLTIPASAVVDRLGYAFPEPAGGGPKVFAAGHKNLFFVQPAAIEDNLVSYTKWLLGLPADQRPTTAAYATEDDPFTQPQVDKAKSLLEAAGIKTVYYKVYPSEPIDYTPLALQVANSKADAVILGTQVPDAIAFVKTFISQHYNPKTLIETAGPDQGAQYAGKLGANTEGIMVPAGWTAGPGARAPTTSRGRRDGISCSNSARCGRCARPSPSNGRRGAPRTRMSSSRSARRRADADRFVSFFLKVFSMQMKIIAGVGLCALATMALRPSAVKSAGGTVAGKVTFTGTAPRMTPIDMAKETSCAKPHAAPEMHESFGT